MDQPDFSEDPSSSKTLVSITTYKDSLDLFIPFKFRVLFTAKKPMLDIIAKEPMLDSVAKDPMLDWAAIRMSSWTPTTTCQVTSQNNQGFLPALGFFSTSSFF
jgi:hypothetical protein